MATSKERQAAFRKRNAALGRSELRGIMATREEQDILKPKIKLMLEQLRNKDDQSINVARHLNCETATRSFCNF